LDAYEQKHQRYIQSKMNNYIGYIGVLITIVCTMYSQLVIKWQVNNAGELPLDNFGKLQFLFILLLNP
jgi:hypothetical protein